MPKHLFTFPCPCCDKMIEVDTRSGKARAVRASEQGGGKSLDALFDAQKRDSERLDDLFTDAKDSESRRNETLEQQLERARREARRDPDQKPPSIFDLD